MAKTVCFIRHGQAMHNIPYEQGKRDEAIKILDPHLTDLGREQAKSMQENPLLLEALGGDDCSGVELVVVSPLSRTIQTALLGLEKWLAAKEGRKLMLMPDLQETGEVACDTGSPVETIKESFKAQAHLLDFSCMRDGWELKEGPNKDTAEAIKARLARFTSWLASRPERSVVVVAHHNLFLGLLKVSFRNCEVRTLAFNTDGSWTPIKPLVSTSDEEMTPEDLKHASFYHKHNEKKLLNWEMQSPPRFR
mmetsp:Transcript_39350/g.93078  ORF Transcript_39350/g.93078 Transcript_39350/m.93078 type:complete len:250 (-) Transcript_39350:179-928(-)